MWLPLCYHGVHVWLPWCKFGYHGDSKYGYCDVTMATVATVSRCGKPVLHVHFY